MEQLLAWFKDGEVQGDDWMLVIRDLHSGQEFPAYVSPNRSMPCLRRLWRKTFKVLATYDLSRPFSDQPDSFRTVRMTVCRKM